MPLRRTSSNETLNKEFISSGTLTNGFRKDLLISCSVDAYKSPPLLVTEKVPILTPEFELSKKDATENDLYFLRWVFNGMFDLLTAHIEEEYPGYQILRPEIEPGISWDEFRSNRRGLLLWLTTTKPYDDPVKYLVDYLKNTSLESSATETKNTNQYEPLGLGVDMDAALGMGNSTSTSEWVKYGVFVGAMARQVHTINKQMQAFEKEMLATRKGFDDIWNIMLKSYPGMTNLTGIADSLPTKPSKPSSTSSKDTPFSSADPVAHEGEGWSVVEDDDEVDAYAEERGGLTSASLSGYDDYDESDLN